MTNDITEQTTIIPCAFCGNKNKIKSLFPNDSNIYPDTMDLYPDRESKPCPALLVSQTYISRCPNCIGEYRFSVGMVANLLINDDPNQIALSFLKREFEIIDSVDIKSPLLTSGYNAEAIDGSPRLIFSTIGFTIPSFRDDASDTTDSSLSSCYRVAFNLFTCI